MSKCSTCCYLMNDGRCDVSGREDIDTNEVNECYYYESLKGIVSSIPKYNLISAKKARKLAMIEYPNKKYLEYMKDINDRIKEVSENFGDTEIIIKAPLSIIRDRIYQELREAGYKVIELDDYKIKTIKIIF